MFTVFQKVWTFLFSEPPSETNLVSPEIESALRQTRTIQYTTPKPRSILKKKPRATRATKTVRFDSNEIREKYRQRMRRNILKYTDSVIKRSETDGEMFRNSVVQGFWNPKTKLRQRRICQKAAPASLHHTSKSACGLHSPPPSPSITPCDDDDYPVSDASTDDDEECYSPRPKYDHEDRLLDPREAYCWFYFVHMIVFEHSRAEFKLDFTCSPLVLVAMVHVGWISVSDATSFAESRHMLGEGLVRANMIRNLGRYDCFVEKLKGTQKPTFEEVHQYFMEWERGRNHKNRRVFDWTADSEERTEHGPFGPALERYARPQDLENALVKMLHSLPSSVKFYPKLDAILDPLVTRRKTPEEQRHTRAMLAEDTLVPEAEPPHIHSSPPSNSKKDPSSPFEFFFGHERTDTISARSNKRYHPYRPSLKRHKERRRRQCLGDTR